MADFNTTKNHKEQKCMSEGDCKENTPRKQIPALHSAADRPKPPIAKKQVVKPTVVPTSATIMPKDGSIASPDQSRVKRSIPVAVKPTTISASNPIPFSPTLTNATSTSSHFHSRLPIPLTPSTSCIPIVTHQETAEQCTIATASIESPLETQQNTQCSKLQEIMNVLLHINSNMEKLFLKLENIDKVVNQTMSEVEQMRELWQILGADARLKENDMVHQLYYGSSSIESLSDSSDSEETFGSR